MNFKFKMLMSENVQVSTKKSNSWLQGKQPVFMLVFLLLGIFNQVKTNAQVTINVTNVSLKDAFDAIERQSNFSFVYGKEQLEKAKPVTIKVTNAGIDSVLKIVFKDQPLTYSISGKYISVKEKRTPPTVTTQVPADTIRVQGTVLDANGIPLIGASVYVKETKTGVATDAEGRFNLLVPAKSTLVISYVGKVAVEMAAQNRTLMAVRLQDNQKEPEVVVTGFFDKSKQTFTGAANTIKGDDIRKVTNQNILSALSVLDPALKLIDNNLAGSDPNSLPDFQLRGPGNINSTLTQEYTGNPNLPLFIMDGFQVSIEKIYDLDPLRVASVTILKDAAALAIYGSRGSNGVVVITTNQPAMGKLRITSTTSLDFESAVLSDYRLLNAADKLEYERLAGVYTPNSFITTGQLFSFYYNERLKLVQQGINTDWLKKPVKDLGIDGKQSIMMDGGDKSFRYSVELSYNPTNGVMKGSKRERQGIGVTLLYNVKNLRFTNRLSYDEVNTTNSPYGSFSTYSYLNPYYSPYDSNGNVSQVLYTLRHPQYPAITIANPLFNATINTIDKTTYNNFINNFGLEWNISNALKFTGRIAINRRVGFTDQFKPAMHTNFITAATAFKGSYYKAESQTLQTEANAGLTYNKKVGKNLVVLNANYNIQQIKATNSSVIAYGFPNDRLSNIGNAIQYMPGARPGGSEATSRLIGFLGNLNYSYDNRFLVDLSIRNDGSSQFGANNKWGQFWSAGLGWNLHNEKIFSNIKGLSLLRVRGSVGFTGSQNFYAYQSLLTYQYLTTNTYNDNFGAIASAYGNEDLKWQRTMKHNVGIDFGFLNDRITGYANVYKDVSKDVLVDVTLPPSLGFSTYKANLGEVQNTGYEVSARVMLIQNAKNNFYWSVFGSAVHNTNKLKKISNALQAYNAKADASGSNRPSVRFIEGESVNTLWVVKSKGIDPATGQEVFYDLDGNITNVWSSANYVPYQNTDPALQGTFGTSVGYKNFQANLYFVYETGGYIYNQTLVDKVENVDPNKNADRRVFYDRWKNPGDNVSFKAINNLTTTFPTSRFVEKNNFLNASAVNVSYTFPQSQLFTRWGIDRARLSAYSNNLFMLSSVQQERGINYPYAKHYALTFQLTF